MTTEEIISTLRKAAEVQNIVLSTLLSMAADRLEEQVVAMKFTLIYTEVKPDGFSNR